MITTKKALANAVQAAQVAGAVGIDTEFVWERTYYPILGLVQMGYPDGRCELIDAPAIDDWSPLAGLIEDPGTVKILHDAQQDLTILKRACGANPKRIFDTQRAAGFVGLSANISLGELLKTLLKVRLDKSETRSDWLARPLTERQESYAMDDVRYSVQLMQKIMARADALERREWILEEMQYYEDEGIYQESNPYAEVPKVRRSGALKNQQRNVLRALGAWRELEARKCNLPRNFILSDDAIVSLIRQMPVSINDLLPRKGLTEKVLKRNRGKIWDAIQQGIEGDLPKLSNGSNRMAVPDDGYESRVDLALAFLKGTCLARQVDPLLVGNRADVAALVLDAEMAGPEQHCMLRSWRAELVGKHLLKILKGEGSIAVNADTKLPQLLNEDNGL